jgi:hypothetical protein
MRRGHACGLYCFRLDFAMNLPPTKEPGSPCSRASVPHSPSAAGLFMPASDATEPAAYPGGRPRQVDNCGGRAVESVARQELMSFVSAVPAKLRASAGTLRGRGRMRRIHGRRRTRKPPDAPAGGFFCARTAASAVIYIGNEVSGTCAAEGRDPTHGVPARRRHRGHRAGQVSGYFRFAGNVCDA